MKYKLINNKNKEEHLCDKVAVDGFEYYVSSEKPKIKDWFIDFDITDKDIEEVPFYSKISQCVSIDETTTSTNKIILNIGSPPRTDLVWNVEADIEYCKKIIATNNPNIDIPKITDQALEFANQLHQKMDYDKGRWYGRIEGYNKSQEIYSFNEEDIIDFLRFIETNYYYESSCWIDKETDDVITRNNLVKQWKEQRIKTLYYE